MNILSSKTKRYVLSFIISLLLLSAVSFFTYDNNFVYTCSDNKTGCASEKSIGWPLPVRISSVNGTFAAPDQEETYLVPVGILLDIATLIVISMGIERLLRLIQKILTSNN